MPETNARIKVCHDTAANFQTNNPTLLVGEWALETDTKKMKIGDGTTPYNSLQYSTAEESEEWQKPAEWIDIRSGAIDNSIYFLVGHAADYSKYPEFSVYAEISNSGTYDVYVDGFKQATTASATTTTLNWQTLALQTGWDVTYPEALRTHIVRVTPSVSTNTITKIYLATNSSVNQGVLWAHFAITNAIDATRLFSREGNNIKCLILEAVTAVGDVIKLVYLGSTGIFRYCENLQYIPVIDFEKRTQSTSATFQNCKKLKKVRIKNMGDSGSTYYFFIDCNELKKIECDGVFKNCYGAMFNNCYKLESLPPFTIANINNNIDIENVSGIKDTILDFSYLGLASRIIIHGTSNTPMRGIKGIILNTAINIPSTTSPQINVSYTGLDRKALVNLFNSMPYNVGYTVVGSPTISSGVVSGFSSSDYLELSQQANNSIPFEMVVCFTANSVTTNLNGFVICAVGDAQMYINTHSQLGVKYSTGSNKWITEPTILSANTKYWGKFTYDGTQVGISISTDGTQFTTPTTQENNPRDRAAASRFGFPYSGYQLFDGSIDLNHTYIKVNGVPWFTGKAAMTKTCNVVGCTGTADLTAEDKAIATDKGWALTLS